MDPRGPQHGKPSRSKTWASLWLLGAPQTPAEKRGSGCGVFTVWPWKGHPPALSLNPIPQPKSPQYLFPRATPHPISISLLPLRRPSLPKPANPRETKQPFVCKPTSVQPPHLPDSGRQANTLPALNHPRQRPPSARHPRRSTRPPGSSSHRPCALPSCHVFTLEMEMARRGRTKASHVVLVNFDI